jgi:hypothetical protein
MRGVYLVAAELSRLGFIASPTSRSAVGADILLTDQACSRAFSLQVKTNARTFDFWLVGRAAKEISSPSHYYALVNLRKRLGMEVHEYYIVPSEALVARMRFSKSKRADWFSIYRKDISEFKDRWDLFGEP